MNLWHGLVKSPISVSVVTLKVLQLVVTYFLFSNNVYYLILEITMCNLLLTISVGWKLHEFKTSVEMPMKITVDKILPTEIIARTG